MSSGPSFQLANPGLALEFQMVDVQDFNGRGESEPLPYFYQVGPGARACVAGWVGGVGRPYPLALEQ